jgi:hypothetical protein
MFTFLILSIPSPLTSIERGARPSLTASLLPRDINAGQRDQEDISCNAIVI